MLQSASVRGPGDNPHAESFFHSLKAELIRGMTFLAGPALRAALRGYIHYYNTRRMHSSLHDCRPLPSSSGRRNPWVSTEVKQDPYPLADASTVPAALGR